MSVRYSMLVIPYGQRIQPPEGVVGGLEHTAGIFPTLQEPQILDLLAYFISGSNSNHVAFVSGASANPAAK